MCESAGRCIYSQSSLLRFSQQNKHGKVIVRFFPGWCEFGSVSLIIGTDLWWAVEMVGWSVSRVWLPEPETWSPKSRKQWCRIEVRWFPHQQASWRLRINRHQVWRFKTRLVNDGLVESGKEYCRPAECSTTWQSVDMPGLWSVQTPKRCSAPFNQCLHSSSASLAALAAHFHPRTHCTYLLQSQFLVLCFK